MPRNSPKHSKIVWETVRKEFEIGDYKSLQELGDKHGINVNTLRSRVFTEKWSQKREMILNKVQQKIEEKAVDIGSEYLRNTFLRAKRWEKIIDKSIDQVGECLEPQDANALSQTEARTHALALSALRLPSTVVPLDITSRGLSIGESIVSAIARLRASNDVPTISQERIEELVECEVIADKPV